MHPVPHIGIDFGSRYAGTTAICFESDEELKADCSQRKDDADTFIRNYVHELQPLKIYIDAPLTLPGAYYDKTDDFFYRVADRKLKAMSPMFIGGLTARAMHLKSQYPGSRFIETYPKQLAASLQQQQTYRKNADRFVKNLASVLPVRIADRPYNWHEIDAILAWYSGWRHQHGRAMEYGDSMEGTIIV